MQNRAALKNNFENHTNILKEKNTQIVIEKIASFIKTSNEFGYLTSETFEEMISSAALAENPSAIKFIISQYSLFNRNDLLCFPLTIVLFNWENYKNQNEMLKWLLEEEKYKIFYNLSYDHLRALNGQIDETTNLDKKDDYEFTPREYYALFGYDISGNDLLLSTCDFKKRFEECNTGVDLLWQILYTTKQNLTQGKQKKLDKILSYENQTYNLESNPVSDSRISKGITSGWLLAQQSIPLLKKFLARQNYKINLNAAPTHASTINCGISLAYILLSNYQPEEKKFLKELLEHNNFDVDLDATPKHSDNPLFGVSLGGLLIRIDIKLFKEILIKKNYQANLNAKVLHKDNDGHSNTSLALYLANINEWGILQKWIENNSGKDINLYSTTDLGSFQISLISLLLKKPDLLNVILANQNYKIDLDFIDPFTHLSIRNLLEDYHPNLLKTIESKRNKSADELSPFDQEKSDKKFNTVVSKERMDAIFSCFKGKVDLKEIEMLISSGSAVKADYLDFAIKSQNLELFKLLLNNIEQTKLKKINILFNIVYNLNDNPDIRKKFLEFINDQSIIAKLNQQLTPDQIAAALGSTTFKDENPPFKNLTPLHYYALSGYDYNENKNVLLRLIPIAKEPIETYIKDFCWYLVFLKRIDVLEIFHQNNVDIDLNSLMGKESIFYGISIAWWLYKCGDAARDLLNKLIIAKKYKINLDAVNLNKYNINFGESLAFQLLVANKNREGNLKLLCQVLEANNYQIDLNAGPRNPKNPNCGITVGYQLADLHPKLLADILKYNTSAIPKLNEKVNDPQIIIAGFTLALKLSLDRHFDLLSKLNRPDNPIDLDACGINETFLDKGVTVALSLALNGKFELLEAILKNNGYSANLNAYASHPKHEFKNISLALVLAQAKQFKLFESILKGTENNRINLDAIYHRGLEAGMSLALLLAISNQFNLLETILKAENYKVNLNAKILNPKHPQTGQTLRDILQKKNPKLLKEIEENQPKVEKKPIIILKKTNEEEKKPEDLESSLKSIFSNTPITFEIINVTNKKDFIQLKLKCINKDDTTLLKKIYDACISYVKQQNAKSKNITTSEESGGVKVFTAKKSFIVALFQNNAKLKNEILQILNNEEKKTYNDTPVLLHSHKTFTPIPLDSDDKQDKAKKFLQAAFCQLAGLEFTLLEDKHGFIVTLPKGNTLSMVNPQGKQKEIQSFQLNKNTQSKLGTLLNFIKKEFVGHIRTHAENSGDICVIEEGENLSADQVKITFSTTEFQSITQLQNDIYKQVNNQCTKQQDNINKKPELKNAKSSPNKSKHAKPAAQNQPKDVQDNPNNNNQTENSESSINPEKCIRDFFNKITTTLKLEIAHKNNKCVVTYKTSGEINRLTPADFFNAVKEEFGKVAPNCVTNVYVKEKEIVIVFQMNQFPNTLDLNIIIQTFIERTISNSKATLVPLNPKTYENKQEEKDSDNNKREFTSRELGNDLQKIVTDIVKGNVNDKNRAQNRENFCIYLEELKKYKPNKNQSFEEQNKDPAYYAYLLHTMRLFALFAHAESVQGNKKEGESIFWSWRNVIRHAFDTLNWQEFYELVNPIVSVVMQLKSLLTSLDGNVTVRSDKNLTEELEKKLEPFLPAIKARALHKNDIDLEFGISRKSVNDKEIFENIDHSTLDEHCKRDAILMLNAWIGKKNKSKDSSEREIYRSLGHKGFFKNYHEFADELFKDCAKSENIESKPTPFTK